MNVKFTKHAVLRWGERFPVLNKEVEWAGSLPATKSVLKKIRKQCPVNAGKVGDKKPFYRHMLSTNMVVFAYDTSGVVITVFPLSLPLAKEGYEWRVVSNRRKHNVELQKKKRSATSVTA